MVRGYVDSLSTDDLAQPVDFVFTSGKPGRMTRGEILLHICLHGNYHRGNAGILVLAAARLHPGRGHRPRNGGGLSRASCSSLAARGVA